LEFSKDESFLIDLAKRGETVKALEQKPRLLAYLRPVWNAFSELSGFRQYGMSANPLGMADLAGWLDENQIDQPERRRWFIMLIKRMDTAWLEHMRKKNDDE